MERGSVVDAQIELKEQDEKYNIYLNLSNIIDKENMIEIMNEISEKCNKKNKRVYWFKSGKIT